MLTWIESTGKSANTKLMYASTVRSFTSITGIDDPAQITKQSVQRYIAQLQSEGKTQSTINTYLQYLRGLFNSAIDKEMYKGVNPFKIKIEATHNTEYTAFLTREELDRLLTIAKQMHTPSYLTISLTALAGLRPGEAVNLQWHHIDFAKKTIHVVAGAADPHTIKGKRARTVPLKDELAEILKVHAATGYVVPDVVRRIRFTPPAQFYHIKERAGLPHCTLRTLRHTFASNLAIQNVSLYKIQLWLGHKSSSITQRYAHLQASDDAINAF